MGNYHSLFFFNSSSILSDVSVEMFGRGTIAFVAISLLTAVYWWMEQNLSKFYIFDPPQVHALVKESLALYPNSTAGVAHHIVTSLRETHGANHITVSPFPDHPPASEGPIYDRAHQFSPLKDQWLFNNAGGAMGSMYLIHASITEYLIIFGTPVGTEGHTGRHTADDYFHILEGEQWVAEAHQLVMDVYPKGSVNLMKRGVVRQYKMHEGCWALELAQGWIPPMLPFGFADGIFSTLDFDTLYRTTKITGREIIRNLLHGKI